MPEAPQAMRRPLSGDRPAEADGVRAPRGETDLLVAPLDLAARILNFYVGYDGVLEPVFGPCPLIPNYGQGYPTYGTIHGMCHATINRGGYRSILLAHVGTELWEFVGSQRAWRVIVGATGLLNEAWADERRPGKFSTQFVPTPAGIVIIPQNGRALFYDGEFIGQFGYATGPTAPTVNWKLSQLDIAEHNLVGGANTEMEFFGFTQFGLGNASRADISPELAAGATPETAGYFETSLYKVGFQWVDRWGNLSPLSGVLSINLPHQNSGDWPVGLFEPDRVLKNVALGSVAVGPAHTVGRVAVRSRELIASGDTALYQIPGKPPSLWATIPENWSTTFVLTEPDTEVGLPVQEVAPMPEFRLGAMALGRFWFANVRGDQGRIGASYPGQWGTIDPSTIRYPDAVGSEITGFWPYREGLLACTRDSIFLVMEGSDGGDIRVTPLRRGLGAEGPSTFAALSNGMPIWLSRQGFVSVVRQELGNQILYEPVLIPGQPLRRIMRCNTSLFARAVAYYDAKYREYRCWLPGPGSSINDTCFTFDGEAWRERAGERPTALAQLVDSSGLALMGGTVKQGNGYVTGVWVLDHQIPEFGGPERYYIFETVWLQRAPTATHQSPLRAVLWLREGHTGQVALEVYRDYREGVNVLDGTAVIETQASVDPPPMWDSTVLGSGARWQSRRLYWSRRSISASGCECFKIRLISTAPFAIMGLEYDGIDHSARMRTEGS